MLLNEKITIIRKMNNLSQEQFAEELSVSRQAVSKWETGNAIPDIPVLLKIADFYNITLDQLVRDEYDLSMAMEDDMRLNLEDEDSDNSFSIDTYKGKLCDISMNSFRYSVIRNVLIVGIWRDMVCFIKRNKYGYFNYKKSHGILIKSEVENYREKNELVTGKCTAYINKGTYFGGMTYLFSNIKEVTKDNITLTTGKFVSIIPIEDISVIFMSELAEL